MASTTKRPSRLHTRGVQVVCAKFGLVSNDPALIYAPEFFEDKSHTQSLLTDFHRVGFIPFDEHLDGHLYILDLPNVKPSIHAADRIIWAVANFSELDAKVIDRRYTLFGNLGLFLRFSLVMLERYHKIYSFHAAAVFAPEENELLIVLGGAGAGKTVMLLEGLRRGYQVFSTELVHFQLQPRGCVFFKGALLDNVRVGNLVYDFPRVGETLGVEIPRVSNPWAVKMVVDFGRVTTEDDELLNPDVTLLFPKIEAGRDETTITEIGNPQTLAKMLFESASEKIGGTELLYESIPFGGLDKPDLMFKRLAMMRRFAWGEVVKLKGAKTILAGTKNCMEGI